MDFTLTQYTHLLNTMLKAGSTFHTYESFLLNTQTPTQTPPPPAQTTNIILRHDVDLLPQNSLAFARIQAAAVSTSQDLKATFDEWSRVCHLREAEVVEHGLAPIE